MLFPLFMAYHRAAGQVAVAGIQVAVARVYRHRRMEQLVVQGLILLVQHYLLHVLLLQGCLCGCQTLQAF